MEIGFAELTILQAKAVAVMFCAGVAVESLWQLKKYAKRRLLRTARLREALRNSAKECAGAQNPAKNRDSARSFAQSVLLEGGFWTLSTICISKFIYYSSFGRLTLYCITGFFAGLLLWKKICCGILKEVWVEKEEAENLKTTAKS